jgi:hypothetical protein
MCGDPMTARRSGGRWLAVAALAAAGCSVSVEAEVQDVEITWHGLRFDAAPQGVAVGALSSARWFELTSETVGWAKQLDTNVRAMRIQLQATDGVTSLDFIELARVTMSGSSNPASAVELMSYQRLENAVPSPIIEVTHSRPIEISAEWSSKTVRVDVTVAGVLPTQPWAMDVTLRLSGEISYQP